MTVPGTTLPFSMGPACASLWAKSVAKSSEGGFGEGVPVPVYLAVGLRALPLEWEGGSVSISGVRGV